MPSNILCVQSLYHLLQFGIITKCVAMSTTVIGVYESPDCSEQNNFRPGSPSYRAQTLLDRLFECIRQVVPAVVVLVECEEAVVWAEFDG